MEQHPDARQLGDVGLWSARVRVWLSGKLSPEQKKEWLEKIENDENLEIECKRTCIIEGMIHKELPIIMVQWHPELMHRDPIKGTLDQDRIFMYFASLLK